MQWSEIYDFLETQTKPMTCHEIADKLGVNYKCITAKIPNLLKFFKDIKFNKRKTNQKNIMVREFYIEK